MTSHAARLLVALAVLAAAGVAHAQSPPATSTPAPEPAASAAGQAEATPRVRASHRVDVIAPGERVDTIIDRLRAGQPAPAGGARPADGARPAQQQGGTAPRMEGSQTGAPPPPPPGTTAPSPTTMPGPGGTMPERHRR
ncbi:MAG: hypothetical protein QM767_14005 [Anaeromyxobacter sp.]